MMSRVSHDFRAVILLLSLWTFFFWRLLTPIPGDQASLVKGDFSGQFVAFAGYQYARFAQGEIPLWNPYNNGGLPFIADTQAAVFYPLRLITIALAHLSGGWSYHTLELEMIAHVLLLALGMYAFVRRLTGSILGGLIASIIVSYGGFTSGYPPLQLAMLEAGIWLPFAALGILEATRTERLRWKWLVFTGFILGVSWLAGHPQSSWFLTYLLVAYFAYRAYGHLHWQIYVLGTALFGLIALSLAAVQLLPGLEYLSQTSRAGYAFDVKGNGFPFQDIIQFLIPGVVSLFSPLYLGLTGLAFAGVALWRRVSETRFWGVVAGVALLLSFGTNSAFFALLYNLLPGLRFFRGQERAAYLLAYAMAVLAGIGAAHLMQWDKLRDFKPGRQIQRALWALAAILTLAAAFTLILWLGAPDVYANFISPFVLSAGVAAATAYLLPWLMSDTAHRTAPSLVIALIVFELFTVNMDADSNYQPVSPSEQLSMTPPPVIEAAASDIDVPFRVDGYRGLHDNYGSLYRLADIRGISPLFISNMFDLIEGDITQEKVWDVMAVRYVYSDWEELSIPGEIIARGNDRYGDVNLHRLEWPRPFAFPMIYIAHVDSPEFARALLADPQFNPRNEVILENAPQLVISDSRAQMTSQVTQFAPEQFTIQTNSSQNMVLSVSHPYYPGWSAILDTREELPIYRAYGALSAVFVPSGDHTITFTYNPLSYRIGTVISIASWVGLMFFSLTLLIRGRNSNANR